MPSFSSEIWIEPERLSFLIMMSLRKEKNDSLSFARPYSNHAGSSIGYAAFIPHCNNVKCGDAGSVA